MLLVQANRRLRPILVLVKEPKELSVILPVPARIVDVLEAFVLDLAGDLVERRKNFRGGRALRPERLLLRQPQRPNASENFQPGQKKPAERREQRRAANCR